MKIKLYIDFDGVILDTIKVTYQMLEELGLDWRDKTNPQVIDFFKNLDWATVIATSEVLNDSLNNLSQVLKSNLYDVSILTHVNSKKETEAKANYLLKYFPHLDIISVPATLEKNKAVTAQDTVLVDDYMGNLHKWQNHGGIPIKFSNTGKSYQILTINNLGELIPLHGKIQNLIQNNSKLKSLNYSKLP